jgi:hypothetical protein
VYAAATGSALLRVVSAHPDAARWSLFEGPQGAPPASIRVAQRLGLRYDAEAELYGTPVGRYIIERAPSVQPIEHDIDSDSQ